jgi:phage terminase large subunit GpA-like protein
VIPPGTSPEPGAWRTDRVPYLREILDAVSDPTVERIYVQAASQVAKSEILLNVIGYYAHQEPSPILLVQSTEIAMRGFSKERVAPMFEASPALRGLLADGARDPSNTVMLRQFPGGLLACAWAGSAASLASRPIRVVLGDELDRWPDTTGRDGDPWAQAVQRTSNFHNRKVIAVSTPTVEGFSAIARLYDDSDQRRYHVPCPRCGVAAGARVVGVIYKRDDGEVDLDQVHYRCAHCAGRIEERDRPAMLAAGEWKPRARAPQPRLPHLARSTRRGCVARARRRVDQGERRARQARPAGVRQPAPRRGVDRGVGADHGRGAREEPRAVRRRDARRRAAADRRRRRAGQPPRGRGGGLGRRQGELGDRVRGHPGDTSTPRRGRLDEFLARTWSRPTGATLGIWCACVDSGGHRTQEVYEFCRRRASARNVFAIKGYAGAGASRSWARRRRRTSCACRSSRSAPTPARRRSTRRSGARWQAGPGLLPLPDRPRLRRRVLQGPRLREARHQDAQRPALHAWTPTRARNEPLDVRVLRDRGDGARSRPTSPRWRPPRRRRAGAAPTLGKPAAPRRRVLSRGIE